MVLRKFIFLLFALFFLNAKSEKVASEFRIANLSFAHYSFFNGSETNLSTDLVNFDLQLPVQFKKQNLFIIQGVEFNSLSANKICNSKSLNYRFRYKIAAAKIISKKIMYYAEFKPYVAFNSNSAISFNDILFQFSSCLSWQATDNLNIALGLVYEQRYSPLFISPLLIVDWKSDKSTFYLRYPDLMYYQYSLKPKTKIGAEVYFPNLSFINKTEISNKQSSYLSYQRFDFGLFVRRKIVSLFHIKLSAGFSYSNLLCGDKNYEIVEEFGSNKSVYIKLNLLSIK
jgi:hypothetical protein